MTAYMSELERRAWETRTSSERHPPEMACKATLDQLERGLLTAKHIVVVLVQDVDGADQIHLLQAGNMSELAVEGALLRAIRIQADS